MWTFLSNHAHVLIYLTRDPEAPMREIASNVGITERAVQGIIADLEAEGYLLRRRSGRRNHYIINADAPLRHQLESAHSIGSLLLIAKPPRKKSRRPTK